MSTPTSTLIDAFLLRIEKDRDFFKYINLSDNDSMALALRRADNYLIESISRLTLAGCNQIDLTDIDNISGVFNNDLTQKEIFLIASIMYEMHLDRDISKIKTMSVNYTPTELRVFDPSNARDSFENMYDKVCYKNLQYIDDYMNRDRLTGKLLGINYPQYDE